jgi:hypothetical protein
MLDLYELLAPTRDQLVPHLERFMPRDRKQQAQHREAVEAVAAAYAIDLSGRDEPVMLAKSWTRPTRVGAARTSCRKTAT